MLRQIADRSFERRGRAARGESRKASHRGDFAAQFVQIAGGWWQRVTFCLIAAQALNLIGEHGDVAAQRFQSGAAGKRVGHRGHVRLARSVAASGNVGLSRIAARGHIGFAGMDASGRTDGGLFQSPLVAGDFGDCIAERWAGGGRLAQRRLGLKRARRVGSSGSTLLRRGGTSVSMRARRGAGASKLSLSSLCSSQAKARSSSPSSAAASRERHRIPRSRHVIGTGEARLRPGANGSRAPRVLRRQPVQLCCDCFGAIGLVEVGGINAQSRGIFSDSLREPFVQTHPFAPCSIARGLANVDLTAAPDTPGNCLMHVLSDGIP